MLYKQTFDQRLILD